MFDLTTEAIYQSIIIVAGKFSVNDQLLQLKKKKK